MKLYAIEYDFEPMTLNLNTKIEHRIEMFSDVTEFINKAKYLNDKYYNSNIKVYSGEMEELNINRVLNPL
jgi:hypothetical protein